MAPVKAYPKYKDSGVPWFGEVPSHWQTPRLGAILKERKETNKSNDVTKILSVMKDRGVIPYEEKGKVGNKCSEDITRYKIVRPDDIVANCMNIVIGSVGLSKYTGCLSPVYYVLMPRSQEDDSRFFDYVFKIKSFQLSLVRLGNGIMAHRMRIPMELLKCETVPKPPIDEQKVIVEYLDVVNKIIRRYIREKQKVIMLLNEKRRSIINRTVTQGIDFNAKFKSSEIDWIGYVPAHWVIKPLKFWVKINQEVLSEDTDDNFEFNYLDIGSVGTGILDRTPEKLIFENAPSRARRILKEGDTIISTVRTYLKAVYFISQKTENLIASTGFAVLTPCANVYPEFLSLVIQSNSFIEQVTANSIGVAYPAIAETKLGALHIAMPLDMSEQVAIVENIKSKTITYDEMIARLKNEIAFIDEYRTRLISDVVTGKVDVRDIKLPEIEDITDSEPIEDHKTLEDFDDTEEVMNVDE
jgi:type I restriction enzyme, S subunit